MTNKVNQHPYCAARYRERKFNKLELEIANWFEQLLRKYSDIKLDAEMMVSHTCGITIMYHGFSEYNEKRKIVDPSDDDATIYLTNSLDDGGDIWLHVDRHHNDVFSMTSGYNTRYKKYNDVLKCVLYYRPLIETFLEMEAKLQGLK